MPLSTSNFEIGSRRKVTPWAASLTLMALAAILYLTSELLAQIGLSRFSKIHARVTGERAEAVLMRSNQPQSVLFTGNSLLLDGIDFPEFAAATHEHIQARRFAVESTTALDWFFTYRQLFREGARPDVAVLCLTPQFLTADGIRGDFSARFLYGFDDIWPASQAVHSDWTTTSGLYFAHFSTFYGERSELRGVLAGKLDPTVPRMWINLNNRLAPVMSADETLRKATTRLRMFHDLCASYGATFVLLIPPTAQPGEAATVEAGADAGVTVLHPIANYSLGPHYYLDNLHLNPNGARIFTRAVEQAFNLGRGHFP